MPNRMLRDWTNSDKIEKISFQAEVWFTRLIMKADDYGCFWADPKRLKANLYPLKSDSVRDADILRWMDECQKAELIVVYDSDNKKYLQIVDFGQRLRLRKAKFPQPTGEATDGDGNEGYVYLIGTSIHKPVKIGFSLNPWARAKELSTGSSEALSVLMTFTGSKSQEKTIHDLLSTTRVKNEWFNIPGEAKILFSDCFEDKKKAEELIILLRNNYVVDSSPPEIEVELEEEEKKKGKDFTPEKKLVGWNTKPNVDEFQLVLPDITAGAICEQYRITKHKKVNQDQVQGLWAVFKVQNFTGEKFYQSPKQVFSHFINWCKSQDIDEVAPVISKSNGNDAIEKLKKLHEKNGSN